MSASVTTSPEMSNALLPSPDLMTGTVWPEYRACPGPEQPDDPSYDPFRSGKPAARMLTGLGERQLRVCPHIIPKRQLRVCPYIIPTIAALR
ncbi:MAG: hypothetical protein GX456_17640 [Verrucomicrobia bacterium]|nr:hypothetical protein [Verrucomicrobiota bacterium]